MPGPSYPVVGSITGQRHFSGVNVLAGGHSLHPLQRSGQVAGPLAPVVPGGQKGSAVSNGPPAGGHVSGTPPLLNLNPIGTLAATRLT
ncbi:MAG TPA: hypothetical protein VGF36_07240 [Rhodopila sp.]|jgi:hypothetical protein